MAGVVLLAAVAVLVLWRFGSSWFGATASLAPTPVSASAFSPGACLSYPPTGKTNGRTVFLDAGHGGIDPGGVGVTESGTPVDEASVTLPVELDAMALLRAAGYRVVVSRTSDSSVVRLSRRDLSGGVLSITGAHDDVVARDLCANLAHANALIGIYFDAGATSTDAGSLAAYDAARPFHAANLRLASLVEADVVAAMDAHGWQIPDDGVQSDGQLGSYVGSPSDGTLAALAASYDHIMLIGPPLSGFFSQPSEMPGTVIEPLYVTDPFEGTIAASTTGQHAIAAGIAQAVVTYFGTTRR